MARALWKAVIEFGAVSVPVKLYTAVRPQEIRFHLLHDQDGVRLRQQMVCPSHGDREVPREHVIRGYELRKDQYVVVQEHDLERCSPIASRSIRVRRFVEPGQIDPLFYEKAYYLGPDEHGHKPYALLAAAMKRAGRVAVVDFVMRGKQYLGAVRVTGGGDDAGRQALVLETMRYADEVYKPQTYFRDIPDAEPDEEMLELAEALIDRKTAHFDPAKFHDRYVEALQDLIERKRKGKTIHTDEEEDKPERGMNVVDLMAALKRSMEKPGETTGRGKASARKSPARKPAAKKAAPKKAPARAAPAKKRASR